MPLPSHARKSSTEPIGVIDRTLRMRAIEQRAREHRPYADPDDAGSR
jgi:hypothetical protein